MAKFTAIITWATMVGGGVTVGIATEFLGRKTHNSENINAYAKEAVDEINQNHIILISKRSFREKYLIPRRTYVFIRCYRDYNETEINKKRK